MPHPIDESIKKKLYNALEDIQPGFGHKYSENLCIGGCKTVFSRFKGFDARSLCGATVSVLKGCDIPTDDAETIYKYFHPYQPAKTKNIDILNDVQQPTSTIFVRIMERLGIKTHLQVSEESEPFIKKNN
eukprot:UN00212